jgi:hypothetical protein
MKMAFDASGDRMIYTESPTVIATKDLCNNPTEFECEAAYTLLDGATQNCQGLRNLLHMTPE